MIAGEIAVALNAGVADIPVDDRQEFDGARPVLGPQGCLQRASVWEVHGRDTPLYHRGGAPGRIAEAELAGQFGLPQIQILPVGEQLGRVNVEPIAAVDAELAGQPVRQVDQTLVLDINPGHVIGEAVVQAGGVAAGVVEWAGIGLGGTASGRAITVTHRAQCLAQPLLLRDVATESE